MNYFKYLILFILVVNVSLNILTFNAGLGRPYINLDYLILLIFFIYKNNTTKFLLFLALSLLYFVDVVLVALQIFPFIRLSDILYLSNFVFNGPVFYRVILIFLILSLILTYIVIRDYFFKKINVSLKFYLCLILFLILSLFFKHLFNPLEKDSIYARFESDLIGSQLLFFIKHNNSSLVQSVKGEVSVLEPNRYGYATKTIFEDIDNNKISDKILLIVNESWGVPSKEEHQDAILYPLLKHKNNFVFLNTGSFNFVGATVAGELRELCNLLPTSFNLKKSNIEDFKKCIPNSLLNLGYKTHAVHGAMSVMYDRRDWYPKAGFQNLNFYEDLSSGGECKSFSGRCDIDLLPYIEKYLLSSDKSFVYWLTLNTHAPYDDQVLLGNLDCKKIGVKENTETCNNYKLQNQLFTAIGQLIEDPQMSGVEIYIVGDHSPPIFNLSDNFFSFKGSEVAWIHFKIK